MQAVEDYTIPIQAESSNRREWFEDEYGHAIHAATRGTGNPWLPEALRLGYETPYTVRGLNPASTEKGTPRLQGRHRSDQVTSVRSLRERLENANNHFRRKAAEVLGDEGAVLLLANLYRNSSIQLEEVDTCRDGVALARLTAANFCEIGARVIYITEAGQGFIESIDQER